MAYSVIFGISLCCFISSSSGIYCLCLTEHTVKNLWYFFEENPSYFGALPFVEFPLVCKPWSRPLALHLFSQYTQLFDVYSKCFDYSVSYPEIPQKKEYSYLI